MKIKNVQKLLVIAGCICVGSIKADLTDLAGKAKEVPSPVLKVTEDVMLPRPVTFQVGEHHIDLNKALSNLDEWHALGKLLEKTEPSLGLFYEFSSELPENLKDSFDFDAVFHENKAAGAGIDQSFIKKSLSGGDGDIVSPRFVKTITPQGDIKKIVPYLHTWIKELKTLNAGINTKKPEGLGFKLGGDSVQITLRPIIWYYTWMLRLLEHPEKPLFVADFETLENAKSEASGLWAIITHLAFKKNRKSGKMDNIEQSLDDIVMNRLRAVNAIIAQKESENNKPSIELEKNIQKPLVKEDVLTVALPNEITTETVTTTTTNSQEKEDAMNKIPVSSMSDEQAARAKYKADLNLQNQTAAIFEQKPEPVEESKEDLGLDLLSDENE